MADLLRVFATGDQAEYERFVATRFDPEALRTTSVRERADRLARLFVDSGGFRLAQPPRSKDRIETAIATGVLTQLPYCLTLRSRTLNGRSLIADFAAADLPLPSSPSLRTPSPAEVSRTMIPFMNRLAAADTFSGVILIARNGRPFLRRAYGRASIAYDERVSLDTRFNTASIGKSFTAVAIGQLLDQGRLSLDDPVGRHLPDFPDAAVRERVTIRHLLTHTSGLGAASEFTASPLWPERRARIRTIADYLPLITGHPLVSEPGAQYAYSNAGFVILGLIIERLTGRPYYDVIQERVFAPAGMTRSFYHQSDHEDPDVATGLTHFVFEDGDYRFRLGPRRNSTLEGSMRGGSHGGAHVTADDLLRFMTAVRNARLTSAATARLLTTPQGAGRLEDMRNGFGFEIMSQNGHTIVGHGGGDIGVSSFIYHFNDSGYTVVVLSNYDPRAIRVIARQVRGLLTRSALGPQSPPPPSDCSPGD
ncbi:MAG TPA: serine hydrolase domain-containing protein [Allosphingosinicella sp.]|nr:serine hydrolase domain-containing protein [Allosphingosinicella sp.]